jgi:hypothetical protein
MKHRKHRERDLARFRTSRRDVKRIRRVVVNKASYQRGDKRGEA